jgi:riboflavin kinase / FMN adenylyltransferase
LKVSFIRPLGCNNESHAQAIESLPPIVGLTIGTFDGLHKGHSVLVEALHKELRLISKDNGDASTYSALLSFYPHPRTVIGKNKNSKTEPVDDYRRLLTPIRVRAARAKAMGLNELRLLHFTSSFSKVSAREFVKKIIVEPFKPKLIVVGFDWAFGKNREGTINYLKELGYEFGFKTVIVEEVACKGKKIGARQIRAFLREGNIREANTILGYPFSIIGKVVKGDGRGSLIGVPTANLRVVRQFLPASGVYKTYAIIDGVKIPSITNVGVRPTFKPHDIEQIVETHLLDFNKNIYNKWVHVEFVDWVREERKFDSVNKLVQQIHADILHVRSN